jgi:ABC-type branched-subunit amino acid transport system ATPase component
MLVAEQNTPLAPGFAGRAHLIETGRLVTAGAANHCVNRRACLRYQEM